VRVGGEVLYEQTVRRPTRWYIPGIITNSLSALPASSTNFFDALLHVHLSSSPCSTATQGCYRRTLCGQVTTSMRRNLVVVTQACIAHCGRARTCSNA